MLRAQSLGDGPEGPRPDAYHATGQNQASHPVGTAIVPTCILRSVLVCMINDVVIRTVRRIHASRGRNEEWMMQPFVEMTGGLQTRTAEVETACRASLLGPLAGHSALDVRRGKLSCRQGLWEGHERTHGRPRQYICLEWLVSEPPLCTCRSGAKFWGILNDK